MSTVWLVTDGAYSDYHVVGVFSTEEDAALVATRIQGRVEEYPLDPDINRIRQGLGRFGVHMHKDGSSVSCCEVDVYLEAEDDYGINSRVEPARLYVSVWAKDEKHAIKIANEKRVQLIANNEWPDLPPKK